MEIDASNLSSRQINEKLKITESANIVGCLGQRFIAAGKNNGDYKIFGTAGNALCAYLDGATVEVFGNVQDAVGDTMNGGSIIIHGNAGDALGYAMRGGKIFVRGNCGYRAAVHLKEYNNIRPLIVIGGSAGSFLAEYLAGGTIILLNLQSEALPELMATGMHGGQVFIRQESMPVLPHSEIKPVKASNSEIEKIKPHITQFCSYFNYPEQSVLASNFYILSADKINPYKNHYVIN